MASNDKDSLDSNLWYREFFRGTSKEDDSPNPDKDYLANEEFQKNNFVDHFGKLLSSDPNFRKHNSYDDLCSTFFDSPDMILQTYCVAEGQAVPKDQQKEWFRSELRFISLVLPVDKTHPKNSVAPISSVSWAPWFWLIAASSAIHSKEDILHVMSWSAADGQFRYYARDLLNNSVHGVRGWVYLCSSENAFDTKTAYLGPLNGHVNGGLVMKELHKPWLHWLINGRGMFDLMSEKEAKEIGAAKWLTAPGFPPMYGSSVKSAENLESIVIDSLREWYVRRKKRDFFNNDGTVRIEPLNIQRWAAHFLLTTNVNIIAAPNSQPIIPYDFFLNYEMLRCYSDLLPNINQQTESWQDSHDISSETLENLVVQSKLEWTKTYNISAVKYDPKSYMYNARKYKICTLQEVVAETPGSIYMGRDKISGGLFMGSLGDGKEDIHGGKAVYFAVTRWGEGDSPWVMLQPSLEDAMGVWTSQKMFLGSDKERARCRLFSDKTFNALMMVDFWNPIFSWRRLRLMQYVPTKTSLTEPAHDKTVGEDVYTYKLEEDFISAIEKSYAASQSGTPEAQFLENLKRSIFDHQGRISNYMQNVGKKCVSSEYLGTYMQLAESRRRMFRPLPMNFFGSNLPYCIGIHPSAAWLEMTEDGTVAPIPPIGLKYLRDWFGSLMGSDPRLIPTPAASTDLKPTMSTPMSLLDSGRPVVVTAAEKEKRVEDGKPALPVAALPKPSTMRMACQASITITNPREENVKGGCPFIIRNSYSGGEALASIDAPTWTDHIMQLFTRPSWPKTRDPEKVGQVWISAMLDYGPLNLADYDQVKAQVVVIYRHIRSGSMPITEYEDEKWPRWAIERLRDWANTGCRKTSKDPIVRKEIIKIKNEPAPRVRKDVMSLSEAEVAKYRMKLDDVLKVTEKDSKWQELGWLHVHAQWCLHYQEATFFWHLAILVCIENLIGFPILYWNGFATEAANAKSKFAGIPSIFLDDEYYHPIKKEWRPNSLRHAIGSKKKPIRRDPLLERKTCES